MTQPLINACSASGRYLVVSQRTLKWFETVRTMSAEFDVLDHETELFEALTADLYDVVFIDVAAITVDIPWLVNELKTRFRTTGVVVIVGNDDDDIEVRTQVLDAGADDIVEDDILATAFLPRLQILLRLQANNRETERRTQALHAASSLAQQFYDADHLTSLIVDTIKTICTNLGAYGVSIIIKGIDALHQYAGTRQVDNSRHLFERQTQFHQCNPYDPLAQVIYTGASMIYRDVTKHLHYTPIPVIENPRSAIVIPLKYGNQVIGSIAVFSERDDFTNGDLAPFELLATHFASAYTNVRRHHNREIDFQSARQILRGWQSLSGLYTAEEVAKSLYDLLADIKDVDQAIVWIFEPQDETQDIVVQADNAAQANRVKQMFASGDLDQLMAEFDVTMQPIIFHKHQLDQSPLVDLLKLMNATDVMLVPVAGSILMGGFLVNIAGNKSLSPHAVNLLESLAHATAQSMERNTIIGSLQEQHGRLNAVLRSINEGIFFVNDFGNVVYCNPQFTELSGVTPSLVIGKTYRQLFRLVALSSADKDDVLEQLNHAVDQLASSVEAAEDYPVVEMRQVDLDLDLYIEFARIDDDEDQKRFIGFVRSREHQGQGTGDRQNSNLAEGIMEDLLLQMMSLQNTFLWLRERYDMLSAHRYSQILSRVEEQVHDTITTPEMHMGLVDPVEFVKEIVSSRQMNGGHHQLVLNFEPVGGNVMLDERHMRQALINVVTFLSQKQNGDTQILVNIVREQQYVLIAFQEKALVLSEETLAHVFDPFWEPDKVESSSMRLAMYISKHIVEAHDGTLQIENRRGRGLLVRMQLPIANIDESVSDETVASVTAKAAASQRLSIIIVESEGKLLSEEYDALSADGHELLVERTIDDALVDLSLARVDLLVVEAGNRHTNIVNTCRIIRQKTDIPVLIAAVPALEGECVRALSNGADGYLLTPIKRDHLMAQLSSIAKRKDIVTRTAAPVQIGDLYIDFSSHRVYLGNVLLHLRTKEYELLRMLVSYQDQVLTHQQLLSKIWGPEYRDHTQYLWVNVSRLRRKLQPTEDSPRYIHTQQGVGYVFREP